MELRCCKCIQLDPTREISRIELGLTCESVMGPASYRPSPLPPRSSSACCCCCNCLQRVRRKPAPHPDFSSFWVDFGCF